MPQVKEPLITRLVKEALAEAELTAGPDNTKFNIKVLVSNPQSETKLGIRIQLRPLEGFLEPDKKGQLEAAIMKKFNNSLEKFNLQISLDTDTQDPEAMGFFIPLPQIKNMIVSALGGTSEESPKPSVPSKIVPKDIDAPPDDKGLEEQSIEHWYCPDRGEECKPRTSGGPDTYPTKAECEAQTFCVASSSPTKAPYKSKKLENLNEMLVRELKRINKVVVKEDFYDFINKGNNILRTLEENGIHNGKKYLSYLVKHNIM